MKIYVVFFISFLFAQFVCAQSSKVVAEKEPTFSKTIWAKDGTHIATKTDEFTYYFEILNGDLQGVKVVDRSGNEVPSKYEVKAKGKGKGSKPIFVEICTVTNGPTGTTIYKCKLVKQL